MKHLLYCDGATYKSNPSEITGAGVICYTENPRSTLFELAEKLPRGTNNTAEYMSLIIGLEECHRRRIDNIWVCMDSQLVIRQCKREWKVKEPTLIPLNARALALVKQFKSVSFYHVPRTENTEADRLSKIGLGK